MKRIPRVSLVTRPNSPVPALQYMLDGRRVRISVSTVGPELGVAGPYDRPEVARAVLDLYRAVLVERILGGPPVNVPTPARPPTLREVLDLYRVRLEASSPRNQVEQSRRLRVVEAALGADRPAAEVTTSVVDRFVADQVAAGLSWASVHGLVTALRAGFNAAVEDGRLPRVPFRARLRRPAPREILVPAEDLKKILAGLEPARGVDRVICLCAFQGLRLGEALAVGWSDLDLKAGTVQVLVEKRRGGIHRRMILPLHPEAGRFLARGRGVAGPVSGGLGSGASGWIRKRTRILCGTSYGAHSLRHTFATALEAAGVSGTMLQALLGHSDPTTSRRYVHPGLEALRAAVGALSYK